MSDGWVRDARVADRLLLHDIRAVVQRVAHDQSCVDLALWWDGEYWFERRALPLGPHAHLVARTTRPAGRTGRRAVRAEWLTEVRLYESCMDWLAGHD